VKVTCLTKVIMMMMTLMFAMVGVGGNGYGDADGGIMERFHSRAHALIVKGKNKC